MLCIGCMLCREVEMLWVTARHDTITDGGHTIGHGGVGRGVVSRGGIGGGD